MFDKAKVELALNSIRREAARMNLLLKTSDFAALNGTEVHHLALGQKEDLEKKCGQLDRLLGVNSDF